MDIHLVRHAASLRKTLGIWGRLFDARLDPKHVSQLDRARSSLASLTHRTVFSSPLSRCLESARLIFGSDEPVVIVDELRAYYSGALEDKQEQYVNINYPTYTSKSFKERFLDPQFGEESILAQAQRVKRGLSRVLKTKSENVVIVTHYSVINIIVGLAAFDFDASGYAEGKVNIVEGDLVTLTVDQGRLSRALADTNLNTQSYG